MSGDGLPYAEVIGDPIDHSLSPTIHGFWLEKLGIKAEYRRRQVARTGLPAYLAERRTDARWRGCNVTMPLKLDALALADDATDRALGAAAANILLPKDGKLLAGNTDIGAVVTAIERLRAAGAPMDEITLLGNGGAARAALMALHMLGIHGVRIQSRDLGGAYKLAVEFQLEAEPMSLESAIDSAGLINATPLGMTGHPPLELDWRRMPATGWVLDFVTAPAETALIRAARERGMKTVTGIAVLVEQAAESFNAFFGAEAPRDADAELFAKLAP